MDKTNKKNQRTKRNIIVSAVLAILLCTGIIVGATFALFTSEDKVNVSVTSGTVKIVATPGELLTYSGENLEGKSTDSVKLTTELGGENGKFVNGGTAAFNADDPHKLELDKMTPGDKVTFPITVTNESNVAIQYRTVIRCEADNGLFEGLKVTIDEVVYEGITKKSDWKLIGTDADKKLAEVSVAIELPSDAGNDYKNTSCTISYVVEAVQANAAISNPDPDVIEIGNAVELNLFRASINKNNALYKNKTVKLTADIDLNNAEWTPIVWNSGNTSGMVFTFDGNGKTIKNFTVKGAEGKTNDGVGFFNIAHFVTIQNLTIDNATVTGNNKVGALVGKSYSSTFSKCSVTNSKITASMWENPKGDGKDGYDDGDKVGALAGYLGEGGNKVNGCTVSNCTLKGYRDVGGLIGIIDVAGTENDISGNTLSQVTIINDRSHNPKGYTESSAYDIKTIVGEYTTSNTTIGTNEADVTLKIEDAQGVISDFS